MRAVSGIPLLALMLAAPFAAWADEFSNAEAARDFIECSAVYDFTANTARQAEKPALAVYLHAMGRGAKAAAAYWLAHEHMREHPDAKPRTYGSWDTQIDPAKEGEMLRLAALGEAGNWEEIGRDLKFCADISGVQAEIINDFRKGIPASHAEPVGIP